MPPKKWKAPSGDDQPAGAAAAAQAAPPAPVTGKRKSRDDDEADSDGDSNMGQAAPQSRSVRQRLEPLAEWLKKAEKKTNPGPTYTANKVVAAGSEMVKVTLGPLSLVQGGNDAKSTLPSGIKLARQIYPECSFKAGHMLNSDLGGYGHNYKNMTILTSSANTSMTKYDNRLKDAVAYLKKLYEIYHQSRLDAEKLGDCIEVTISVDKKKWGTHPPDSYIAQNITLACSFVRKVDLERVEESLRNKVTAAILQIEGFIKKANGTIPNIKPFQFVVKPAPGKTGKK